MKVMRMATGRGKSHFNITDFLQPFFENKNLMRYPFLTIDEDRQIIRDKTSYLPACTYSEKRFSLGDSCNLFTPVLTDFGICYSFNAEPSLAMLENSSFTEAFQETYKNDLKVESSLKKAKGAGDDFSLKFMVDNSKYLRKKLTTKPFKIIISSGTGYFNAKSEAREIKPGFITTFNVQPIEVYGTKSLAELSEEARGCKFSDDVTIQDSLFKIYSQTSCEYECQVTRAREVCQCTPWNFPTPPSMKNPTICDLYGNYCFHQKMRTAKTIEICSSKCPSNCNDVQWAITKEEIPINEKEHCDNPNIDDGYILTKDLIKKDYFALVYEYYKMEQYAARNDTQLPKTTLDIWREECYEIMKHDIAIVNVRMGSGKYIRTIKDKRMTFADKLAAFGKLLLIAGKFILHSLNIFTGF